MGEVWLAEQQAMTRKVALKILSPSLTNEPEFINRFKHEIKMAGMLEHPNIATAFHAGSSGGIHYLAISFIEGIELAEKLRRESILSEREALQIAMSVSMALKFAWDKYRMLHRDIKPSNIMIEPDGTVKIMDLGLSKCVSEKVRLTMTGVTVGTPDYMSPEQALGAQDLDFRADIYSLGATLFFIATGRQPFIGDSPLDIATKHITEELTPPEELNPKLSQPFSELIQIMMEKDPDERQASWDEVIMDIERVTAGYPPEKHGQGHAVTVMMKNSAEKLHAAISTEKIPVAKKASKANKKSLYILIASLAVLLIAGILFAFSLRQEPPKKAEIKEPSSQQPETASSPPKKTTQKPKDGEDEKAWKKAMAEYEKFQDNYDQAVLIFEDFKKSVNDKKFRSMASNQIELILKEKENAIKSLLNKLKLKSLKFFSENKFDEAVATFTDYDGPLAQETLESRKRLAKNSVKKYQDLLKKRQMEQEEKEAAAEKQAMRTAAAILKGNFIKARELFSELPANSQQSKDLKSILAELDNYDKLILKKLSEMKGKNVEIETNQGTVKGKLKKINGATILLEKKMGKALFIKKILLKNLSLKEKRKRLCQILSPEVFAVCMAAAYTKEKEFKKADDALKRSGQSSRLFRKALLFTQPEKLSEAMQKDFNIIEKEKNTENAFALINTFKKKYALAEDFKSYENQLNDIEKKLLQPQKKTVPAKIKMPSISQTPPASITSPKTSTAELNKKLKEINPSYRNKAKFKLENGEITEADLSKCRNISDISPLRGLRLKKLYLPDSVTDLSPLQGMPLENLRSESKVLSNLEVLQDMPLVELYSKAELDSISYLDGLKLQYLYLANSRVKDLTPLKRMPLTHLYLPDTVNDLAPLKETPLQELFIPHSRVKDLTPLKNMPLERLDLMNTRISDLTPLGDISSLNELNLFGCTNVKGLEPLMRCENLEKLVLPTNLANKSGFLRRHPGLKFIGTNWPPGPAQEFWKDHK
jgi:serine/threonine-protein kinase